MRSLKLDPTLSGTLIVLVVGGLFIFLSASLGLLARGGASFSDVAYSQIVLGLGGGGIAFLIATILPYRLWRRLAFLIFPAALVLTALVFAPVIGTEFKGAHRWLSLGPLTLQPSEFLKIAYVIALAAWLSMAKRKLGDLRFGLLPFMGFTAATGVVLLFEPDTDTFALMAAAGLAMFFAAGAKMRDLVILVAVAALGLAVLVTFRPYLADRVATFLNPSTDPRGTSYQIQQSLLAIGAGELFGRGFGQSVQKFGTLPEPISDSIFSVFAEEFGFIGSAALVIAFLVFVLRGLWIAARSPDLFGGLLALGIVVLIGSQAFLNIGAMLGLMPLSGLPLPFVSHGGTALMAALGASGLLLSVSRSTHS
jgi:cell division protein FtsW